MGIVFQSVAIILVGNRELLPFLYTVQISNFFLIASFAMTSFGLISFDGKLRKNVLRLFAVAMLLFYISFISVADKDSIRIIIQIIASSFFYGIGGYYLFRNKTKYKFVLILSATLMLYAVFQLIRAYIIYRIGSFYVFMNGSTIDNFYLIISLLVISVTSIGFVMLLKEINEKIIIIKNIKIQEDKGKLEELNRTKDKLFSIIAHDLRSPFNSILGFSELLISDSGNLKVEETQKYIGYINSSAKSTLNLLDNLLNWAKSQTGKIKFKPEKIIVSLIIQEIIDISNSPAKIKNISIINKQSKEVVVCADRNMLMVVMRNLMSNAIKFTRLGGQITIDVISKNKLVEISISDSGVGMHEDIKKQLFTTTSYTTSRGTENEKGSGLGLILCKEFIEKHGGTIWVESEVGKGSDFKFTLPI